MTCDDSLCEEFGHASCEEHAELPKSAFWASVAAAAKEVETWPEWKKAGVVARRDPPMDEKS